MKRFLRKLEDALWPRGLKCLCCDALSEGHLLCPTCLAALKAVSLPREEQGNDHSRSVYRYEGVAKQLVLLLKEECAGDAALPLAQGIAATVKEMHLLPDTVLTWVTMPEVRRMKRGIDHGRTLCEAVAALTGFEARQLLVRVGSVHTQRGLDRTARLQNLSGTIACKGRISVPVLLIDDVMTTGATSSLCADVLKAAGATDVYVLTATRAMLKL